MDLELENKIAIVTGGTQGIGRATAMRLAKEGAAVVIAARLSRSGRIARFSANTASRR